MRWFSLPRHAAGRPGRRLVVVAGLLVFFFLALDTAVHLSATTDELVHLTRAYVLRQTGDLRLQYEHGPLSHRIEGLLLEPAAGPDVTALASWVRGDRVAISQELFGRAGVALDEMLWLGRVPVVLLSLLLGAMIVAWAGALNGRGGQLIALVLFAFSPNLLAHAALATTDMVATATYFATVYAWWRTWQRPGAARWLFTAVLLGCALAAKLTAVLLLPLLLMLAFVTWRRGEPLLRRALLWLGLLPVAAVVVWALYGFELRPPAAWVLPVPAATYVESWLSLLNHVSDGHPAFFLGELSRDGWWHYFPVVFGIKTPLVTLLLGAIGLAVAVTRRELRPAAAFLVLPGLLLLAAAVVSRLNIGYRHILPLLPFVMVLASTAVVILRQHRATQIGLALALFWTAVAGLRQHPHHLSYFNELVGGSDNGYRYLGDSNLDWGQALNLLAARVKSEDVNWRVAYAGVVDPAVAGLGEDVLLDSAVFAPANPQPGRYAISANNLQGILDDQDRFDWFRRREPDATIGGAILIYDVATQAEGDWVAHCLDPVPLLDNATAERIVGRASLRHVTFDCRRNWVWPAGGAPGWWIVPQADGWWVDAALPEGVQQVYRHAASAAGPSYDVLYWPGGDVALADGATAVRRGDGSPATLPLDLAGTLALESYQHAGQEWHTLWRVAAATADPLSLQAHLYSEGEIPAVADGLGFSSDQWRRGDRFIERHLFVDVGAPRYLETGLTNYVTATAVGERLRLPAE